MTHLTDLPSLRMHWQEHGQQSDEPAVLLLHGWPQTSACWDELAPLVADGRRLIAPDLRGYGLTDKPTEGYTKRRMAADVVELLDHLGLERVHLVGHDRGARVGHRFAVDHPERLHTLTVLDVAPTHAMFSGTTRTAAGYFHWLFHMQDDLPELLTSGREEEYLRYFFQRWTLRRDRVEPRIPEYVQAFRRPGAMRAGFDDYRATWEDIALDEEDLRAGRRVTVPTLALWGAQGLASQVAVDELWRPYIGTGPQGEGLLEARRMEDCGHFIPEEQPEQLAAELTGFWGRHSRRETPAGLS